MGFTMVFLDGREVKVPDSIIKAYFPTMVECYPEGFHGEEVKFPEVTEGSTLSAEQLEKVVLPFLEELQKKKIPPLKGKKAYLQTVEKEKVPEWVDDYFNKLEWMEVFRSACGATNNCITDYGAYAEYYYMTHEITMKPGTANPFIKNFPTCSK